MNLKEIKNHITISDRNIKLGKIPNISLPPITTCNKQANCRKGDCYALKAFRMFPSVRQAWAKNLSTYQKDPDLYFKYIDAWIEIKKPSLFRFHVAGDIPDQTYFDKLVNLCANLPDTKFLLFTKQYGFIDDCRIPCNLSIVISSWPELELPDFNFPVAWFDDGSDDRIPDDAITCHGSCDHCGMCWSLKMIGKDVVFKKH